MKLNTKNIINSFLNYIAELKNTPDEELGELGKLSKFWADSLNEKDLEKIRDYRNKYCWRNTNFTLWSWQKASIWQFKRFF